MTGMTRIAAADAEQDSPERDHWLARFDTVTAMARAVAETANPPDPIWLTGQLKAVISCAGLCVALSWRDHQALVMCAKSIELTAYRRAFEHLMDEAESAHAAGRTVPLGPSLGIAAGYVCELRKRGVSLDQLAGFKARIDGLYRAMRGAEERIAA
jgi:hypothetical protein